MKTPKALILLTVLAAACAGSDDQPTGIPQQASLGVTTSATGGGYYLLSGVPVQFSFSATQQPNGHAAGNFHIVLTDEGFTYDIHGRVTCLSSDPSEGRAWIGGVITKNTTTDPALQDDIHQPGRDVWFRVLDAGEGQGAVDRTTFYGFEGGGGIITSAQYCAAQLWPADNARTWPVESGNISVR